VEETVRFKLSILFMLIPGIAFGTCGEKGGPGYREPGGKCVSWKQIGKVCGNPPETRCSPEMAHKDAADAARSGVPREDNRAQTR
jgi:hypothetical protein